MIDPKANVASHKPPLPPVELNKPREDDGFHHDGRIALPRWECDRIWQHVVDMSQPSPPQPKAPEFVNFHGAYGVDAARGLCDDGGCPQASTPATDTFDAGWE